MADPVSRPEMRARLRGTMTQVKDHVRRVMQRWLPVDEAEQRPSHHAYITTDGQMCCG